MQMLRAHMPNKFKTPSARGGDFEQLRLLTANTLDKPKNRA